MKILNKLICFIIGHDYWIHDMSNRDYVSSVCYRCDESFKLTEEEFLKDLK